MYNMSCVRDMANIKNDKHFVPGCGSAWLERLIWDQEVAGSNPVTPTYIIINLNTVKQSCGCSSMVEH